MKRLAILTVMVLGLGGCGGPATTPAASAATTQQPSFVATPAPTPLPPPIASPLPDLASLASQYTEISAKGDAAVVQCTKDRAAAVGSLAKSKTVAQGCLTSTSGYVAELKAINWGPVQPHADGVIAATDKVDALLEQMANAASAATFKAAYDQLASALVDLVGAADALRSALGLPPAQL
jgi:hypothetical protein